MMDVTENYDPDFIYTDGTYEGPFTGRGTGTGYKCNDHPSGRTIEACCEVSFSVLDIQKTLRTLFGAKRFLECIECII